MKISLVDVIRSIVHPVFNLLLDSLFVVLLLVVAVIWEFIMQRSVFPYFALLPVVVVTAVKGGDKVDHWGGGMVDHLHGGSWLGRERWRQHQRV